MATPETNYYLWLLCCYFGSSTRRVAHIWTAVVEIALSALCFSLLLSIYNILTCVVVVVVRMAGLTEFGWVGCVQKIQNEKSSKYILRWRWRWRRRRCQQQTIAQRPQSISMNNYFDIINDNAALRQWHQFYTNRSLAYSSFFFVLASVRCRRRRRHRYWAIALRVHTLLLYYYRIFYIENLYVESLLSAAELCRSIRMNVKCASHRCACAFINFFFKLSNFAFVLSLPMTMTESWYPQVLHRQWR